jgi:hypothetical protein
MKLTDEDNISEINDFHRSDDGVYLDNGCEEHDEL